LFGIRNAIVTNEPPHRLQERFLSFFDQVLVDAPCSGEGMFRKNPEAVATWSLEKVKECAAVQREILPLAADMLRPGGYLLFEVGEDQAEAVKDMILSAGFLGADTAKDTLGVERVVIGKMSTQDNELWHY
jgi:methylase of polypeptide subunit release factors